MNIMELKYLQKLSENKKIGSEEMRGVSEEEIISVEQKLGFKFPQVYREYLFIGGAYTGWLFRDTATLKELSSDWHMELLNEVMADFGTVIDRPFWVYSESNGCEQFKFFYLDEGDDPFVNTVDYADFSGEKQEIIHRSLRFSQMIDISIDSAKRQVKLGLL